MASNEHFGDGPSPSRPPGSQNENDSRSPEHLDEPKNPDQGLTQVGGVGSQKSGSLRATMLTLLTVLAGIYTIYFAKSLLLPVAVAVLVNFLLQPFSRFLHRRLRFPYPLAAAVIALVFTGAVLTAGYGVSYPLLDWIEQAPRSMDRIQQKFASGQGGEANVFDKVSRLLERIESMTGMEGGGVGGQASKGGAGGAGDAGNQGGATGNGGQAVSRAVANHAGGGANDNSPGDRGTGSNQASNLRPGPDPVHVRRSGADLSTIIMGYLTAIGKASLTAGILVFFLLASGDTFLRKLMHVLPRVHDKKKAAVIAHQVEHHISTFLVTYTAINICLGLATTGVMYLLGMPNPWLWGAIAMVFNYVPYVGPVAVMVILLVVGLLEYESISHAMLAPVCFFGLNLVEAYAITPMLLGKRLSLHPVAVLVSITFWSFLWGVAGAIMAVPLLVGFKILCDHVEPLQPISEFLSGDTTQRPSDENIMATDPDKHPSPQPRVPPGP